MTTSPPARLRPDPAFLLVRAILLPGMIMAAVWVTGATWVRVRHARSPHPPVPRVVAWIFGFPEAAYNFGVVERGRLYRSADPDVRFLRYVVRRCGIRRVVCLSGTCRGGQAARGLGLEVLCLHWEMHTFPSFAELARLRAWMAAETPILVFGPTGRDQAGFAVALYRVLHEGWHPDHAIDEMKRHGHRPEAHPEAHRRFRAYATTEENPAPPPAATPAEEACRAPPVNRA